jgi:hypothetical protein
MGAMPGDPYVAPEPERPYLQELGSPPGRLRVAFTAKTFDKRRDGFPTVLVAPGCERCRTHAGRVLLMRA